MSMMKTTFEVSRSPDRLMRWQWATVALMVAGYAGYYLCRSNLSVCIPLIRDDLVRQGLSANEAKQRVGMVVSFGILAYAVGKFFAGGLADFQGGRRNYLGGMIGSIGFTILFALGGSIPLFTLASVGNRFVQSFGWAGMIKITSRWFPSRFLWPGHGVHQSQLPVRRCAGSQVHGLLAGDSDVRGNRCSSPARRLMFVLLVINMILLKENSAADRRRRNPSRTPTACSASKGTSPCPRGCGPYWQAALPTQGFLVRPPRSRWG